jgi:hypothetical protein
MMVVVLAPSSRGLASSTLKVGTVLDELVRVVVLTELEREAEEVGVLVGVVIERVVLDLDVDAVEVGVEMEVDVGVALDVGVV